MTDQPQILGAYAWTGRKFEYRVVRVPPDESDADAVRRLNDLGGEGWQMVQSHGGPDCVNAVIWLMRELP